MRNNRTHRGRTFYEALIPLADAIRKITSVPQLSEVKDVPALLDKQAAKRQRRADRARHAGQLK